MLLLFCLAAQGNAGLFWAVLLIPELPGLFPLTGVTLASFLTRLTVLAAERRHGAGRRLVERCTGCSFPDRGCFNGLPLLQFPKPSARPPMLYFIVDAWRQSGGMAAFSDFPARILSCPG